MRRDPVIEKRFMWILLQDSEGTEQLRQICPREVWYERKKL